MIETWDWAVPDQSIRTYSIPPRPFHAPTMEIGQLLRRLRRKLEFSQEYIAIKIELSQKQVSRIESGAVSPRADTLKKWCEVLGLTLAEFFRKLEKLRKRSGKDKDQ